MERTSGRTQHAESGYRDESPRTLKGATMMTSSTLSTFSVLKNCLRGSRVEGRDSLTPRGGRYAERTSERTVLRVGQDRLAQRRE